jgi:thiamine pyrophosphate-dependent acetolactate synthase large subunit-like protein
LTHYATPRDEQGAGLMVDGYGRATDAVGFIVTDPGMTNITTAMAQARRSPFGFAASQ